MWFQKNIEVMVLDNLVYPFGEIGSTSSVFPLGIEVEVLACGQWNDFIDLLLRNVFDVEVYKHLFEVFVHEQDSTGWPAEAFFFTLKKDKNTFH